MDNIISRFAGLDLAAIGVVGHLEKKRKIVNAIRVLPVGFNDDVLLQMENTAEDDIEDFNAQLIAIRNEISEICANNGGLYGSINFGKNYRNYTRIRNTAQLLNNNNITNNIIINYILLPIASLPEVDVMRSLDGDGTQKRFSKICLNHAVHLTLEKLSFIEGYWRKVQQQMD